MKITIPSKNKKNHSKECKKCGFLKPLEQFGKWRYGKDGLNTYCKSCWRKKSRASKHKKLIEKCVDIMYKIELEATTTKNTFNELYLLQHLPTSLHKIADLAWEFVFSKKFEWPSEYKKPEIKSRKFETCSDCGHLRAIETFITGYTICSVCAERQKEEMTLNELLD